MIKKAKGAGAGTPDPRKNDQLTGSIDFRFNRPAAKKHLTRREAYLERQRLVAERGEKAKEAATAPLALRTPSPNGRSGTRKPTPAPRQDFAAQIRHAALFRQRDAIKRSPRLSRSPYPIISIDTTDDDEFVVRVSHSRDQVTEYGVGSDWEQAHADFRRIADRARGRA